MTQGVASITWTLVDNSEEGYVVASHDSRHAIYNRDPHAFASCHGFHLYKQMAGLHYERLVSAQSSIHFLDSTQLDFPLFPI